MPPRNDPPKKFSKLLYFRGLFCQTQSQTPLLAPPTARHTEVFSFSPPCKLGGNMPPAFWCRGSSGRAMCPRAVWCPGIVQGVPCVRVPFWCPGIVQGVQLATARTPRPLVCSLFMYPRPCVIEAPKYHRSSELWKVWVFRWAAARLTRYSIYEKSPKFVAK